MIEWHQRLRIQALQGAAIKSELKRLTKETVDFGNYSTHMSVVLSLVLSLAAVAIISKKQLTNSLWVDAAAFAVPLPIALYLRGRIVRLGAPAYVSALIVALAAAILFGI